MLPDSKEAELENSIKKASASAGKNSSVVLVPYFTWKFVPEAIPGVVDIPEVPGCHLLKHMNS